MAVKVASNVENLALRVRERVLRMMALPAHRATPVVLDSEDGRALPKVMVFCHDQDALSTLRSKLPSVIEGIVVAVGPHPRGMRPARPALGQTVRRPMMGLAAAV